MLQLFLGLGLHCFDTTVHIPSGGDYLPSRHLSVVLAYLYWDDAFWYETPFKCYIGSYSGRDS